MNKFTASQLKVRCEIAHPRAIALPLQLQTQSSASAMTTLFRRIQPSKKFRISISTIARFLRIPKQLIVRVECWEYVIFIHRLDKGGQFISYRKLREWQNAVACQIQNCATLQQLQNLWQVIEQDEQKHKNQYGDEFIPFLRRIWTKRWQSLTSLQGAQAAVENFSTCVKLRR